jgi:hypothetical protein
VEIRGGGLTSLWSFRAPQTTMTVSSSSSLLSFTAGVCGVGEQGTWGWSVVSGDTGWQAYLPVELSCAPNDDDSVVIVAFAVLYSGDVWRCRAGPWGWSMVSGKCRW